MSGSKVDRTCPPKVFKQIDKCSIPKNKHLKITDLWDPNPGQVSPVHGCSLGFSTKFRRTFFGNSQVQLEVQTPRPPDRQNPRKTWGFLGKVQRQYINHSRIKSKRIQKGLKEHCRLAHSIVEWGCWTTACFCHFAISHAWGMHDVGSQRSAMVNNFFDKFTTSSKGRPDLPTALRTRPTTLSAWKKGRTAGVKRSAFKCTHWNKNFRTLGGLALWCHSYPTKGRG